MQIPKPNTWQGFVYWWLNLLPGESPHDACLDRYKFTLNLPTLGAQHRLGHHERVVAIRESG